jgi:hypothetical protein
MPNINAAKGFLPFRHLDGSAFNGQFTPFLLPTGDAVNCFVGDMVKWGGSAGTAGQTVAGMNVEGMPTAATFAQSSTIAVGTSIAGVVRGFLVDPTNLTLKHRVASTARIALVVTDPTVTYEIQEDATAPFAAADIGLLCSWNTGAGSTVTGISGSTLNNASKNTTSTLPIQIRGLIPRVDNAFNTAGAGTDPAKFEVLLNATGTSVGGVGVAGTS